MFNSEVLGKRIKEARQNKGLTQAELADLMNYAAKTNISRFESGKKTPSLEVLDSIATALGTTSSALLDPSQKASELSAILAKLDEILTILR